MGLGGYLAYVFLFGMIPYMGWCVGRAARATLFPHKTTKKVKVKSVKKATPTPVRTPKPSKGSYPVESSFKEEYRITNPVEFDT